MNDHLLRASAYQRQEWEKPARSRRAQAV